MTTNQLPASTNVRRLKLSVWWLVGIGALLVGAVLIFAVSRNVPVRPIASQSSLRVRITGFRSEHFDAAAQNELDDQWAYPAIPTYFTSTDDTKYVERALERDRKTYTLPMDPATKRVIEYLRTHPTVPTAPNAGS